MSKIFFEAHRMHFFNWKPCTSRMLSMDRWKNVWLCQAIKHDKDPGSWQLLTCSATQFAANDKKKNSETLHGAPFCLLYHFCALQHRFWYSFFCFSLCWSHNHLAQVRVELFSSSVFFFGSFLLQRSLVFVNFLQHCFAAVDLMYLFTSCTALKLLLDYRLRG